MRAAVGAAFPIGIKMNSADFLRYAEQSRKRVNTPLMVTGGFRSAQGMAGAVSSGAADVVGLARSLAVEPDLCRRILLLNIEQGENVVSKVRPRTTGIKSIDDATHGRRKTTPPR